MAERTLEWGEVQAMRQCRAEGWTYEQIGNEFGGIPYGTVWDIVNGLLYRDEERQYRTQANTGCNAPMVAMPSECVGNHHSGQMLSTWLRRRGCDQRTINQITARRFARGSYRPSDRAALLLDCNPELTPYADDQIAAD